MKKAIDSTMIEEILDLATNLAEENGYEYMPHALFNSEDRMYIDKAIGRLQERGELIYENMSKKPVDTQ